MTRILVLEPTTKDISAAESFGDIVYLFDNNELKPNIWDTQKYLLALQERLLEIEFSKDDFFLAAGATIPLVLAMSLLSSTMPEFRVLFWHSGVSEYVARSFNQKDYEDATTS